MLDIAHAFTLRPGRPGRSAPGYRSAPVAR